MLFEDRITGHTSRIIINIMFDVRFYLFIYFDRRFYRGVIVIM